MLNVKQDSFRVVSTINFKTSVAEQATKRNDDWGKEVYNRICIENDLVAAEARYHVSCYWRFRKSSSNKKLGRPVNDIMQTAFENVCIDIENDFENCQFSFKEIYEKLINTLPPEIEAWSEKYLKTKIVEKYGNNVVISDRPGKSSVFCFRDNCEKLINDEWCKQKNVSPQEERARILKT